MMHLCRIADVYEFYRQVESFLLAREAEHCLMLGLCATLMKTDTYPHPPYLAYVQDGGEVVAVALRTPPYNLVLSEAIDQAALPLIAEDALAVYEELHGVTGPKLASKTFADLWQNVSGQGYGLRRAERIYRLKTVRPVVGVQGAYRLAIQTDRPLLIQWLIEFADEALDGMTLEDAERIVDIRLNSDPSICGYRIWEDDDKPVSFAGYGGPTPNGMRIGPVYTPSALRGHGYASRCVAALSQELLDSGRKFVFLFTDLSNPTSNHIYQVIGYEPVSDVDEYRFEEKS